MKRLHGIGIVLYAIAIKMAWGLRESGDIIEKMIQYCREKGYISEDVSYDIDSIADEIIKMSVDD